MTMSDMQVLAHLRAHGTDDTSSSMVIIGDGGMPVIAHWGADLGDGHLDARHFSRLVPGGALDAEAPLAIITEASRGYTGVPGIDCSRDGQHLVPRFEMQSAEITDTSALFVLHDDVSQLTMDIVVSVHTGGVITIGASVTNNASSPLSLSALRLCVPVGASAREILTLGGRHAMENVQQRTPWDRTTMSVTSRSGRTGHEQQNVVFVGTSQFGEHHGEVWGAHLAWSGNFEMVCDGITDARRSMHAGELLAAGEVQLHHGHSYCTPMLVLAHSSNGLTNASRSFHSYARSLQPARTTPRPVHLNTWEAVYFNHDLGTLTSLATAAAAVGIERYVLDDGWFHQRRNDTAGLGDWWVDPAVWPDGLTPLVNHVRSLGMQFGLWFEPEMVNPDSDLFRAHPEWALHDLRYPMVQGRHQLVLNMALPEVRDYLFASISAVLSAHDISYVKWDHNRPIIGGMANAQTLGTYALFESLTRAFPHVEFESCASGGGRVDMGIAPYVHRFWTSDSIDALDRVSIQRGFSMLMPPEVMGAHIGGPVCHTTGRRHTMSFRAATAMFGWLGVEWNILEASERERERLAEMIALHKTHRTLLHSGLVFRGDHPDHTVVVHGIVAADKSEALVNVTRVASGTSTHTAPVQVQGLDAHATYEIHIVLAPTVYALHRAHPEWMLHTNVFSITGAQLASVGINMPALMPESAMVLHLVRRNG